MSHLSVGPGNIRLLRGGGIILKIYIYPVLMVLEPVMFSSNSVLRPRLARYTQVLESLTVELALFLVPHMSLIRPLITIFLVAENGL